MGRADRRAESGIAVTGCAVGAPQALIFDLFGTLVFFDDSRVPRMEIAGRSIPMTVEGLPGLLREYLPRVDMLEFLRELRSVGAAIAEQKKNEAIELHTSVRFERTLLALGADAEVAAVAAAHMARLHMNTLAGAVVCPAGRRELLERLSASYRLALVSNFDDAATARRVLDEAGLARFFDAIVISQEEGLRKPSRVIFERACARLGSDASACLYIGDTLVDDIEGARGAGIPSIWIHPDSSAPSPAEAVLADVSALPGWLAGRGFSAPAGASR